MPKSDPPVNLDKYLEQGTHRYVTYAEGAKEMGLPFYSFVHVAKKAGATIVIRRNAMCDMNILYRYLARVAKDEGED